IAALGVAFSCGTVTASGANADPSPLEGPRAVAAPELGIGRLVADLEFAPVSGKKSRLSQFKSAPVTVIAFTSTSCPVTKRYAPTLVALEKEFSSRGVKFVFVNAIGSDSERDAGVAIRAH